MRVSSASTRLARSRRACSPRGLDRIDAAIDQLLRAQLDVMRELVVHFLFDRHAPEQRSQALSDRHGYTALIRTRLTAAEKSIHAAVWLASCCRPVAREPIELRAPAELGRSPFRVDQPRFSMRYSAGIERPLLDLELAVGDVLDPSPIA